MPLSSMPDAIFTGARSDSKDPFARSQCVMRKHDSTSPYRTTRKPRVRTSAHADCTYTKTPACSYPPSYRGLAHSVAKDLPLLQPPNNGNKNAEPLQSQFLRHANFKHVDRFCSLKQLKLDKALRRRGAAKGRKRICKYVVPPVAAIAECISRSTWWEGSRETHSPAPAPAKNAWDNGQLLLLLRYTRHTAIADPCAGA